jgi:multiple sugar transport system substrate-binding protein
MYVDMNRLRRLFLLLSVLLLGLALSVACGGGGTPEEAAPTEEAAAPAEDEVAEEPAAEEAATEEPAAEEPADAEPTAEAPAEEEAAAGGGANSIRVSSVAGAMHDVLVGLAEQYMEQNPDVEVTVEDEPEGGVFQALIAAGNQPDLVVTSLGPALGQLAADNALVPLEELDSFQALIDQVDPGIVEQFSGHNYYVPIGADVTLMIYNKDLFEQAGLDPEAPPETWDEFLTAAQAIDELGDDIYGTVFWNEALAWGGWYWNMLQPIYLNGNQGQCQLVNRLGTDIVFDDPECGMEAFFEFTQAAQQYAPLTMETNFFSRKIGMWPQYGYSWEPNLETAADQAMVIGEDVGVAPVPVPNAGDTSFTTYGGRALIIMKTTPERQERAWDFLQFLMEEENNRQFITELGYLPTLLSLREDAYFQEPARQVFVEVLENGMLPQQFSTAETVANEVQAVYQQAVVEGALSATDAVTQASEQARSALQSQ